MQIELPSGVPGTRQGHAQRHELLDILAIALVASVCGAENCAEFATFAKDRETLLREFLDLGNGLPNHGTFSQVFRLLDPAAFARVFETFLDDLGAAGDGVRAIDAKTLRRSFDCAASRSPLHVKTAFGSEARVAIAQRAVAGGGNEILAAQAFLRVLALDGILVCGDGTHAQAGIAKVILDRGGNYLFALKADRPAMFSEVEGFFVKPLDHVAPTQVFETTDADHGLVEVHRHRVTHSVDWLSFGRADEPPMPGLATIGCVETTHTEAAGPRAGTSISSYYLSSARLTPETLARAVRAHGAIENARHWVLDVAFNETRVNNRRDYELENLAVLRRLAVNLLNNARPKMSAARKRKRTGWSDAFARTIIGQMR